MPLVTKVNQGYTQNTTTNKKPVKQESFEKKIDKRLACSLAATVGIAALAGAIIYKVRSGRNNNLVDDGQKIVEQAKHFFNKDNQLIEGVTLQNGKAINRDGSMFSGILNTINKKGEKITIQYQDGFMTSSTKDGKLLKRFENIKGMTREQGALIIQLDDEGLENLVVDNFRNFFRRNVKLYGRSELPVGAVGSIAFYYSRQLERAAVLEGFELVKIVKSPMDELVRLDCQAC